MKLLTARRKARRFAEQERAEKALKSAASKKSAKRSTSAVEFVIRPCSMVYKILVVPLCWVPGVTRMSGYHLLVLLHFRRRMATVSPVVSLTSGGRNAPKLSFQDLKAMTCRVTDDRMITEKVCLIILIFPSVISSKFVPKFLYLSVRTMSMKM